MSQTTEIQIQNQNGLSFRTKLNQMLSALNTVFSGTTAPATTEADMLWLDTSVTPNVLKRRNSSNTAWESFPVIEGNTHAATTKTTPIDADEFPISDSASSFGLKKLTFANLKTTVKAYLDPFYYNVTANPTFRNRIINGAMRIDQRNAGASQTFTAGGALAYSVDRFYGFCTGANITGQRVALSTAQNRYRFTGAASNTGVGFGQRIEAANSLDLAGGTATLQVKLSSSSLTSITWTAYYANTTDSFGTLASPTRTQIATGTFTINSTEATYSTQISIPSSATTGIEIVFTGAALLASQTLTIGDVQFESGGVMSKFELIPLLTEEFMCDNYYRKSYRRDIVPGSSSAVQPLYAVSVGTAAGALAIQVMFGNRMRTTPTVTVYNNVTGATGSWRRSDNVDIAATTGQVGDVGFTITNNATTGAASAHTIHWTAAAEL